jgi:hypothetical protein
MNVKPITHLTVEQHKEAARLLKLAQDSLFEATSLIYRTPYTDQSLRLAKAIQELMVEPLDLGWPEVFESSPYRISQYSVHGGVGFVQRLSPRPSREGAQSS